MRNKGNAENSDRRSANRIVDLLSEEFMYGRGAGGWQSEAACAGRDDLDPMSQDDDAKAELMRVCESCPVREQCGAYADEKEITSGIWGGVDRSSNQ